MSGIWNYGPDLEFSDIALHGFDVLAVDGKVGTIVEANSHIDAAFMTVRTRRWPFEQTRVIPGLAVTCVNIDDRQVEVALTKSQVRSSPDVADLAQRRALEEYYGLLLRQVGET